MKILSPILLIVFALAFGSCSPSGLLTPTNSQPQESDSPVPSANSADHPISPINTPDFSETTPPPADANPFVKLAEEDLASRLNIPTDRIHFLKISDIDWQDLTQGCTSSPGQTLTKGKINGYRIWLEANGKNYLYHIGLDNTIFSCPD